MSNDKDDFYINLIKEQTKLDIWRGIVSNFAEFRVKNKYECKIINKKIISEGLFKTRNS